VFVGIRPDEEEVERAQEKLDLIHRRLESGEAFGAVARELSDDPAARQESAAGDPPGDLGWFEPGDLDPRFETVITPLSPGEFSEPFQAPQGIEIMRLIERDGDRMHLQHIRVSLEITEEAVTAARRRADQVQELAAEGADFSALVGEYSDDQESAERGGHLGSFADGELNPEIDNAVRDLEPGGVSEVVVTDQGFHIFKLVSREGGGQYEYEEIAERLRARIGDERAAEKTEEWLAEVRDNYFIRRADRERQPGAGLVPATGGQIHVDVGSADKEDEEREEAEPAGAQNEE
jgi:peptidyl-prolyl cis-trans isomerase SurA